MNKRTFYMLLALGFVASGAQGQPLEGRPRVVDGDTLAFGKEKVRLHGIDAPESKQSCATANRTTYACGATSTLFLKALIDNKTVSCSVTGTPSYGRHVCTCFVDGKKINAEMVRAGMAIAARSFTTEYVPQEDEAKAAKRGIWQGHFTNPDEYRRQNRKGVHGG